jgi:hypothetical protein
VSSVISLYAPARSSALSIFFSHKLWAALEDAAPVVPILEWEAQPASCFSHSSTSYCGTAPQNGHGSTPGCRTAYSLRQDSQL